MVGQFVPGRVKERHSWTSCPLSSPTESTCKKERHLKRNANDIIPFGMPAQDQALVVV